MSWCQEESHDPQEIHVHPHFSPIPREGRPQMDRHLIQVRSRTVPDQRGEARFLGNPQEGYCLCLILFLVYFSCSCSCFLYGGGSGIYQKKFEINGFQKHFIFCYEANEFHQGLGKTRLSAIAGKVIHRLNILTLMSFHRLPPYSFTYINIHDHCSITENFLSY